MRSISAQNRRVALLREFEGGGLSMAEFCRRRGLGYSTMMAWRRAWRSRPAALFVEVETGPAGGGGGGDEGGRTVGRAAQAQARSAASVCAELLLPGGAVLRIYQMVPTGGQA